MGFLHNIFLAAGLLTGGQHFELNYDNYCGFYHQSRQYNDETYTINSLFANLKLIKNEQGELLVGISVGLESHYNAQYFNGNYIVSSPQIGLLTPFNKRADFGLFLEPGKYFDTIGEPIIRDKGYDGRPTFRAVFLIQLDEKTPENKKSLTKR
ncbi:MAG: hypothetical protein QXL01_00420 [Thermoplasmatales archaeon]